MKTRNLISIASAMVLLGVSVGQAGTFYWDGGSTNQPANGNSVSAGGNGTWNISLQNWDAGAVPHVVWNNDNNDTAVFGGTVGTVTNQGMTVGGLQFDTTAYVINNTSTLSFGATDNLIAFNNAIAAATITGPVGGNGNVSLYNVAQTITAGTLTFNGTSATGWSGTTTINPGMTLATVSTATLINKVLSSTTGGITLNGGAIQFTRASNSDIDAINNSAIGVNGGGTFSVTSSGGGASASETIGTVTVNSGQMNFVQTANNQNTLTLGGLSRGAANTSAITISAASSAFTTAAFAVSGASATAANEIIGPWATVGTAANAQTDYAVYDASSRFVALNTAASTESTWSTTHALTSNYTLLNAAKSAANGLLSATRKVNTVRNTTASSSATAFNGGVATLDYFTLASHTFANGDVVSASGTGGLLNGGDTYYVINSNVGGAGRFQLSTTSGGSAVDLSNTTAGTIAGGITLSTGKNLETYGILNGSTAALAIGASGTGVLTTPTGGGSLYLTTGSGAIFINAPITDAPGGGAVTVVKSGTGGRLNLTGNNTFSGGLVVNGGIAGSSVYLSGTQSFTGGITLNGGGIGENSANSTPFTQATALNGNAITVNGPSHLVVEGTLPSTSTITINPNAVLKLGAGNSTLTVQGVVSGSGVLDVNANNFNSNYPVYLTNTGNTFTGDVTYNASNGANTLSVASIGDGGKVVVGMYANTGAKTFELNSAASAALTFNTRQFELAGPSGGHNLAIDNNSTQAFNINTDLLVSGVGTRTLTLQGAGAGLSIFNGIIANGSLTSLALTKAETGTWALTKTNTYTGATTISGGTLQIGNGSTIGSLSTSSTITITSPGTLRFNRSNAVVQGTDFSGAAITGTGALIQSGSDTLTLNVANTFTGTTTVSAGKILMTNPLALQYSAYNTTGSNGSTIGLDVTSGLNSGTLTLGGLSGSVNLASAITAGYTGSVANLTLNPQSGISYTYTGSIANATTGMTLTKTGAGTQELNGNNTFTGNVVVNAGTLKLGGGNACSDIAVNGSTLTSGGTAVGPGTLGAAGGTITFTGTSFYNPQRDLVGAYNKNVNISSGTTTFQQSTQFYHETFSGVLSGSGTIIKNDSNGVLTFSNAANTFTGAIQLAAGSGGLVVNSLLDSANAITFNGNTGALSLGAGTASSLLFNSRQIVLAHANGGEIANNNGSAPNTITINTNLGVSGAGTRTLELSGSNTGANAFNGIIGNNGGSAVGVTKAGNGLWILSGANTYTGITTVSGGILAFSGNANVASANPLGQSSAAAGNLLLANGTTLQYVGAAASIDRNFTLNVASNNQGASLDASGTGAVNFTSTASPAYGTVDQPRTLTLAGSNTGNNTLAASIANNGTGATSISKTGIGTWVLSGASNPFTGTTTLSGGGKLVLDYTSDTTKLANGAALILQNGGGELTLRGGSHLEAVGSLTIGTGGGHTHVTREVGSTAKLAFGVINRSQSAGCTLSLAEDNLATTTTANIRGMLGGPITLGSNWAKNDGSGNIIALPSGDYTALPTTATTSTLNYELVGDQLNHTGTASMNSLRIVGTGATDQSLNLNANQLQLGTVTLNTVNNSGGLLYAGGGTGNYTITGTGGIQGQNGSQELIINTYAGTLTLDMVITTGTVGGGSSLTKFGAGTLVLTKASAYASGTYVNQGTLRLANNTAAGTTAGGIFVANGAAVEFAGGINIGAEAITATGTGVANGGTLRNASGNNTYGGAITVGTGGTRINSDSGLLTLIGGIVTAIDKHLTIGGAGNITISTAAISGTGNLIKDGAGTLTLTANNTYSGATLVNEGTMIGVVGGSCSNSAVTVASAILVVSVIDNTKQWTCASLALNTGSKLKFICSVNPGAVAPLNIKGDLTFSGTEIVIEPRLAPGQYPLLTVGGTAPTSQTLPTLSGVTGKLTWIDKTLWLTVIPNGTLIQIF